MELSELVSTQQQFDREHGWTPVPHDSNEVCNFIARDLIGLFGEMGEFANVVKKLQLEPTQDRAASLERARPQLAEELVDFFIYVVRVAAYLQIDLEREYIDKLSKNDVRFRRFLKNAPPQGSNEP